MRPAKRSVWYLVKAPRDGRISVKLDASGDLDTVVDTYLRQRSQTKPLECDLSDKKGLSEVSFKVKEGQSYLIRVGERQNSASGDFKLDVFLPEPPPVFPGPRIPAKGLAGKVDVLQNRQDAYSVVLHSGVTYRINLALAGEGCASLELYGPSAGDFDDPVEDRLGCSGYGLYTPAAGEGGRTACSSPRPAACAGSSATTCRSGGRSPTTRHRGSSSATSRRSAAAWTASDWTSSTCTAST